MINLINYYRPLSYDERKELYREIIDLPCVRNTGLSFKINNKNSGIYGCYSTEGVIRVNLENQPNLAQLITTIAHEIAHDKYFDHGSAHDGLTSKIKNHIKASICKSKVKKKKGTKVGSVSKFVGSVRRETNNLDDIYEKLIR